VKIVKKACQEPCFLIAQNAGFEGAVVVQKVLQAGGTMGFNAYEGEHSYTCDANATPICFVPLRILFVRDWRHTSHPLGKDVVS